MKTILDLNKVTDRRRASIAATFVLAAGLTGSLAACDNAPPPPQPTQSTADWTIEQSNGQTSQMVLGRDNCIEKLVEVGRTKEQAEDICDKAFADAQAKQSVNKEGAKTVYGGGSGGSHGAGANNNALLWYMIGRNSGSVSVYEGNAGSSLRHVGGYQSPGTPATVAPRPSVSPSYFSSSPSSVSSPHIGATSRGGFSPGGGVGGHGG